MSSTTFTLKKLSHLCLGTRQLDKLVSFYCDNLQCKIIHEFINPKNERYGVFLAVHGGTFLEIFNDPSLPQTPDHSPNRFRHFCFEVSDIQEAADCLRKKGFSVEIFTGKTDKVPQFWIEDPDTNRIEFHQYDTDSIQYPYL